MKIESPRAAHGRAIVLGASMAGLLAGRVLSERFDEVVLIERDALPDCPVLRKGTPHAGHAHGLLARGRLALEELFPGFERAMQSRGCPVLDVARNVHYFGRGEYFARGDTPIVGLAASRPALEAEVRQRVLARPNVRVLAGTRVIEPVYSRARQRVTGVRFAPVNPERGDVGATLLAADLVVDATGRGSQTPRWLSGWGFPAVIEERVTVGIGYATAYFERDPSEHDLLFVCLGSPGRQRGGVALAQEPRDGDVSRWVVTLGGYAGDHPEPTLAGLRRAALETGCAQVARITHHARPLGEVARFAFPHSQRRRYERMRLFPRGYLVIGDAMASFNPIYGQGMSVAAVEALALREVLQRTGPASDDLGPQFFAAAAKVVDNPWQIAAGADYAQPAVVGKRSWSTTWMNRYMDRVMRAAQADPVVANSFIAVTHLLRSPGSLLAPSMLARVLGAARSHRDPSGTAAADLVSGG